MYAMCHYTAFVCHILLPLIFIYVAACITGTGLCRPAGSPWLILKSQYHSVIKHNHIAHGHVMNFTLFMKTLYNSFYGPTHTSYIMYIRTSRTYAHDIHASHTYVRTLYIHIHNVCMYICMYACCMHAYMYVRTYVYMCVYIYYIYIYSSYIGDMFCYPMWTWTTHYEVMCSDCETIFP